MTPDPAKPERAVSPSSLAWGIALQGVVFCGLGLLIWQWSGRDVRDFIGFSLVEAVMGVAIAGALIGLAHVVFRGFPPIGEKMVRLQAPTFAFLGPRLGWPAIILISLNAGIGEEALFRAGLQTWLGDHLGVAAAILLSSAGFAAIHMARPVITLLLLGIGAIFGVLYWQTGSLLAVMIGHTLYDIWALRYLLREMHRLNLFDQPEPGSEPEPEPEPAPLVNSPDPG